VRFSGEGPFVTGTSFYSLEKMPDGRSGGTTQAETRVYNERLVVALVRRHGQLSKSDLARLTSLAPQTITTIVNRAAENGLLLRREPLRGRLGQPSIPFALNPEAAFSFGLKVDHRSADVALVNFVGDVMAFERVDFDYPTPSEIMTFAKAAVGRMRRKHKSISSERIAGLGIASPFHQWNLAQDADVPKGRLDAWNQIDIRAELDRAFDWPVYLFNDSTVCAAAELMFGAGTACADFIYAYVGYSFGGGLVLDHHLFPGRNRMAGSLGELPVHLTGKRGDRMLTLREVASLHSLASKIKSADRSRLWSSPDDWGNLGGVLAEWIDEVADGLAQATRGAVALIDVDNVVVDGAIPPEVRKEIAKATRRKLARVLGDRPEPFSVLEGKFGHLAPAIGGASIPLLVKYSNDKESLFKD
jgi:predicted NBD/HSP70 family sugar kinase